MEGVEPPSYELIPAEVINYKRPYANAQERITNIKQERVTTEQRYRYCITVQLEVGFHIYNILPASV